VLKVVVVFIVASGRTQ